MNFAHLLPEERVYEEWNAGMPVFHIRAFQGHQHQIKVERRRAAAEARATSRRAS